jgi:hypothetical protein
MRLLLPVCVMSTALLGCAKPHEFFPLKVGNKWTYKVNTGLNTFLENVDIGRTVPGEAGVTYELSGTSGTSRLSWNNGVLLATSLSGDHFNPPLPLLDGNKEAASLSWSGSVYSSGKTYNASGVLTQDKGTFEVNSQKRKAMSTILTLKIGDRIVKVESSYVRGMGLVSQIQRTTTGTVERFNRGLEYIGGP